MKACHKDVNRILTLKHLDLLSSEFWVRQKCMVFYKWRDSGLFTMVTVDVEIVMHLLYILMNVVCNIYMLG